MSPVIDKIASLNEKDDDLAAKRILEQFNYIFEEVSEGKYDALFIDHIKKYGKERRYYIEMDSESGYFVKSHPSLRNVERLIVSNKTIAKHYKLVLQTYLSKSAYIDFNDYYGGERGEPCYKIVARHFFGWCLYIPKIVKYFFIR